MKLNDFFKKNGHLKLGLQHLDLNGGVWRIQIYNTTYDFGIEPVFEHLISDAEVETCVLDFETVIMTPILNWWKDSHKDN